MMGNSLLRSTSLKPLKTPRDYQDAAFPAVLDWFENKAGNPLVVVPTGGGKSLIMAEFIRRALEIDASTRFLVVTHVSELLTQNAQAIIGQCPSLHLSFYSDKLGQKDLSGQVIVAGIQSIYKKAHEIHNPAPDIILIDEVHTLPHSGEGMYRKFINDLKTANPYIKLIGMTATPFRAKTGLLYKGEGAMFGGIAYEVNILDLIEQGYLSPVSTPTMTMRLSTEGVKVQGGDYVQKHLEAAVDKDDLTTACVDEIMQHAEGRNKWLVFTAGVNHCLHVRDEIRSRGIACEMLTGETETGERNRIIAWHKEKAHEARCLVNVSVLTTGYDNPAIDLIAFMRPTRSPVLYVQMIGRGMRIFPGKDDCVVLDFGGVIDTLGPIDQIRLPTKRKGEGEAPHKTCPECGEDNHAAARLCIQCGFEFPAPKIKIEGQASGAAVLSTQLRTETYPVTSVSYRRHKKEGKPDTFCVEYMSGMTKSFRSWWCLEHVGRAREMAAFKWRQASGGKRAPNTVGEALERTAELRKPVSVTVKKAGKYFEVIGVDYE